MNVIPFKRRPVRAAYVRCIRDGEWAARCWSEDGTVLFTTEVKSCRRDAVFAVRYHPEHHGLPIVDWHEHMSRGDAA